MSLGKTAGYSGLALASALAAALACRYGERIVAWDRRVRQQAYDRHPALQLWHNPNTRPTPAWMWVPVALFFWLLALLFAASAATVL